MLVSYAPVIYPPAHTHTHNTHTRTHTHLHRELRFTAGKFECDEEHEKYDACDGATIMSLHMRACTHG